MRRFFAPLGLLAALAFAAPAAQADVTASVITTPTSPQYLLYPADSTIDVAGQTTGVGNVDIVCQAGRFGTVLLPDVPVAGDGSFSVSGLSLAPLVQNYSLAPGQTCKLRAVPAGAPPNPPGAWGGPLLAVSHYSELPITAGGANNGMLAGYYLSLAGEDRATDLNGPFGRCGEISELLDPQTLQKGNGFFCSGAPLARVDGTAVKVDGQPAYGAGDLWSPLDNGLQDKPGFPDLKIDAFDFDHHTGAATVVETSQFARCGTSTPLAPTSCTSYGTVPVQLQRTVSVSPGDHIVRFVDRWSSTDGRPHQLDISIQANPNAGSDELQYRFPGETGYAPHDQFNKSPTIAGPFAPAQPVLVRNPDPAKAGEIVLPLQSADGAQFFGQEAFTLDYRARTIPAAGDLTFTHYYAVVRRSDEVEAEAAKLVASLAPPQRQTQPPATNTAPASAPARLPRFSRHGKLRVRRSGRTFRVLTRDHVACTTACTLRIRGQRVAPSALHLTAGQDARIAFKLTRTAARALRRHGRLRLSVTVSWPGATHRLTATARV
jgi:hypothetical protein